MPYRSVLCAIDFSEGSRAALRAAVEIATKFDAVLTLVHVYPIPLIGYPEITPNARFMTQLKALAEQALADWRHEAEQLAGRSVNAIHLEGVPWDRIVKLVREGGYDLLVLSTHGRTGLKHALIGSVAEKVVRHAPCPVFVVR